MWSGSSLFDILSLITVYTICHSQQLDKGLHYLPFSAVWSGSTLFAILSLIRVYTICHTQQSDHGLNYLPFFLRSITQYYQGLHCLPYSAVWCVCTLFAILSSLIRVYTICHSQQSDQGLQYLPFSVWSVSTPFAVLSSLIRVYSTYHSQQSDHSSLAVLWRSTLFAILSSLIRVYTICHSQPSDQGLHCHSEQSYQDLHNLQQSDQGQGPLWPSGIVWSRSTLFAILSRLIMDYTISHFFLAVLSRSTLSAILS